jgi:quinoprotein glucose dehydrogenase
LTPCEDAATGELLWVHGEREGPRGQAAPRQLSGRGLSYWTDGREERIYYVTPGYRMIALDAKTGNLVPGFGTNGALDLKLNDDQEVDLVTGELGLHSAPIVAGDTIIVGAAHRSGGAQERRTEGLRPRIRCAPASAQIFHTIPSPANSDTTL